MLGMPIVGLAAFPSTVDSDQPADDEPSAQEPSDDAPSSEAERAAGSARVDVEPPTANEGFLSSWPTLFDIDFVSGTGQYYFGSPGEGVAQYFGGTTQYFGGTTQYFGGTSHYFGGSAQYMGGTGVSADPNHDLARRLAEKKEADRQQEEAAKPVPGMSVGENIAFFVFGQFPERLLTEGEKEFEDVILDEQAAADVDFVEPVDVLAEHAQALTARLRQRIGESIGQIEMPPQLLALFAEPVERIQQVQEVDPAQAEVGVESPPQAPSMDEAQVTDAAAEEIVMVIGDEAVEVAQAEQRLQSLGTRSQEQEQLAHDRPMSYCIPDADRYRPLGS